MGLEPHATPLERATYEPPVMNPTNGKGQLPQLQASTAPNKQHCDILSWNQAIANGMDPRTSEGTSRNSDNLTAAQVAALYGDKSYGTVPQNTSGYMFFTNADGTVDHVAYYSYTTGNDYTVYQSASGITPQQSTTWSIDGNSAATSCFAPLSPLETNAQTSTTSGQAPGSQAASGTSTSADPALKGE